MPTQRCARSFPAATQRPARGGSGTSRAAAFRNGLLLAALLAACGEEQEPAPAPPANGAHGASAGDGGPHGATPWHADFPQFGGPVHRSPETSGQWYGRTRRQALERVIQNLSGACSRDAWLMAKQFFDAPDDETVELLIETFDRATQERSRTDHVQNLVEAMGSAGDPRFAPALLRALAHELPGIRAAAARALVWSGDAASTRRAFAMLPRFELLGQMEWVKAACRHLQPELPALLHQLISDPRFTALHRTIVEQAVQLPPELQRPVLEPLWPDVRGDLKIAIAVVFHRHKDARGSQLLKWALEGDDPKSKALALEGLAGTDLGTLLDLAMAASVDRSPLVRRACIAAIAQVPGPNVDNTLLTLSLDADEDVRLAALRALRDRGVRGPIEQILTDLATGSGNVLVQALEDVVGLREEAAVPLLVERLRKAPQGEERRYLTALGRIRSASAFAPLRDVLLAGERPLAADHAYTTASYAALQLANLDGVGPQVMALLDGIDRADYRRRACLLTTLGNIAARQDTTPELRQQIYDRYRAVVRDRTEIPQLRLLCMEWLRRDLTLEDAMEWRQMLGEEAEPMRKLINDQLFEFF